MASSSSSSSPFVSTQKATESLPAVLHPLVLLSISDHITRHTLRKLPGPVVGAILGQQNGRQVTLEHTFDFHVEKNEHGEAAINPVWFNSRLDQMRTVHKERQLDLVGWYAVIDRDAPLAEIYQVHEQILAVSAESSAILLTFYPDDLEEPSVGGKLPLTIYETNYEPDEGGLVRAAQRAATTNAAAFGDEDSEDKEMKDASALPPGGQAAPTASTRITAKFLEIPYTVETAEAEMISVDFVARGVANAAAADGATASTSAAPGSSAGTAAGSSRDRAIAIESGNKGKRRLVAADSDNINANVTEIAEGADLSVEDLEVIATLTTRANAIRMLHSRLQLLTKYLESLPESELEAATSTGEAGDGPGQDTPIENSGSGSGNTPRVAVSLPILRSIQALVHRLPLVVPPPVGGAFEEEQQRESNDVALISMLLDNMMQSVSTMQQVSSKFGVVDQARIMRSNRSANGTDYGAVARGGLGSPMGSGGLDMML